MVSLSFSSVTHLYYNNNFVSSYNNTSWHIVSLYPLPVMIFFMIEFLSFHDTIEELEYPVQQGGRYDKTENID